MLLQALIRPDSTAHLSVCAWLDGLSLGNSCSAAQCHEDSALIVWQQRVLPNAFLLDLYVSTALKEARKIVLKAL